MSDDRCSHNVNSQWQSVALFLWPPSAEGCGIADLVFVLDSSGSVSEKNWYETKQFVIDVVKALNVAADETHVSVISYSTEVRLDFDLDEYFDKAELESIIWEVAYMAGTTNTADGIRLMRDVYSRNGRSDVKSIAVVITDGKSNILPETTAEQAELARQEGVDIFAIGQSKSKRQRIGHCNTRIYTQAHKEQAYFKVALFLSNFTGIGSAVNQQELISIASKPATYYVHNVNDYDALSTITQTIIDETCETGQWNCCHDNLPYGLVKHWRQPRSDNTCSTFDWHEREKAPK